MDETIKDPVCGMEIDPLTAKYKTDYEGKTYYFCSADCRDAFEAEPEEYAEEQPRMN